MKLIPIRVLYYYDGPLIFSANFHSQPLFFIKIDEDENKIRWLTSVTNDEILNLVENCELSVRGAVVKEPRYIVETQHDLEIVNFIYIDKKDLREEILPKPGIAIKPGFAQVPDETSIKIKVKRRR
jgi:hypothetical protein